ncbi:hypothetical protein PILCRDRAFT_93587 [Piloderma croceum F 1598]|uniref:Uncharacterized protein n=1 Tax=Piloderma croceum (strain F 1598) TaxID=765440 RepID=A0A0C3AEC9_PILCF|nr:hypothetical protein PILCRDRAFT_93587 [Piloderma croceum F 1598]
MPLILKPTSSCDICKEDYNCDKLARSPHSIDCGHIFCKTLHVNAVEGANSVLNMGAHSSALLERIALVSNESSTTEDVLIVVAEHKPLRLALDALSRYRSLRAVESNLRMQLQEEREAASLRHNKLQTDLKVASSDLQIERGRFIAELGAEQEELWAEQEALANIQNNFLNILREAGSSIQTLRSENGYLLSELQSAQAEKSTGSIHSIHAVPVLKNTSNQGDVSSPQSKLLGGSGSSSLEDVIKELQGRCPAACGKGQRDQRSLTQCLSFGPGALSLSRDGLATPSALPCIPKSSRQLLKMASSPSFRKNGDKCSSGTDRQGMATGCMMQFQPDTSWDLLADVTTGMREASGDEKHHNSLRQWWPHSWKIFRSSGACI